MPAPQAGGMVDDFSFEKRVRFGLPSGAELGKSPMFKGFSHLVNGFVLSKLEKLGVAPSRCAADLAEV
jgi:hypothetical protein